MHELRWWERLYFGVITVAALFVTWLGFSAPARMDESFTWALLPPLHAGFVGALYLFGGVYLLLCATAVGWPRCGRRPSPACSSLRCSSW